MRAPRRKSVPPDYDFTVPDAYAIRALSMGEASSDQQIRAVRWIVERAAGTYQDTHLPTDRDTTFANGRRFVGLRIVTICNMPAEKLAEMARGPDERSDS